METSLQKLMKMFSAFGSSFEQFYESFQLIFSQSILADLSNDQIFKLPFPIHLNSDHDFNKPASKLAIRLCIEITEAYFFDSLITNVFETLNSKNTETLMNSIINVIHLQKELDDNRYFHIISALKFSLVFSKISQISLQWGFQFMFETVQNFSRLLIPQQLSYLSLFSGFTFNPSLFHDINNLFKKVETILASILNLSRHFSNPGTIEYEIGYKIVGLCFNNIVISLVHSYPQVRNLSLFSEITPLAHLNKENETIIILSALCHLISQHKKNHFDNFFQKYINPMIGDLTKSEYLIQIFILQLRGRSIFCFNKEDFSSCIVISPYYKFFSKSRSLLDFNAQPEEGKVDIVNLLKIVLSHPKDFQKVQYELAFFLILCYSAEPRLFFQMIKEGSFLKDFIYNNLQAISIVALVFFNHKSIDSQTKISTQLHFDYYTILDALQIVFHHYVFPAFFKLKGLKNSVLINQSETKNSHLNELHELQYTERQKDDVSSLTTNNNSQESNTKSHNMEIDNTDKIHSEAMNSKIINDNVQLNESIEHIIDNALDEKKHGRFSSSEGCAFCIMTFLNCISKSKSFEEIISNSIDFNDPVPFSEVNDINFNQDIKIRQILVDSIHTFIRTKSEIHTYKRFLLKSYQRYPSEKDNYFVYYFLSLLPLFLHYQKSHPNSIENLDISIYNKAIRNTIAYIFYPDPFIGAAAMWTIEAIYYGFREKRILIIDLIYNEIFFRFQVSDMFNHDIFKLQILLRDLMKIQLTQKTVSSKTNEPLSFQNLTSSQDLSSLHDLSASKLSDYSGIHNQIIKLNILNIIGLCGQTRHEHATALEFSAHLEQLLGKMAVIHYSNNPKILKLVLNNVNLSIMINEDEIQSNKNALLISSSFADVARTEFSYIYRFYLAAFASILDIYPSQSILQEISSELIKIAQYSLTIPNPRNKKLGFLKSLLTYLVNLPIVFPTEILIQLIQSKFEEIFQPFETSNYASILQTKCFYSFSAIRPENLLSLFSLFFSSSSSFEVSSQPDISTSKNFLKENHIELFTESLVFGARALAGRGSYVIDFSQLLKYSFNCVNIQYFILSGIQIKWNSYFDTLEFGHGPFAQYIKRKLNHHLTPWYPIIWNMLSNQEFKKSIDIFISLLKISKPPESFTSYILLKFFNLSPKMYSLNLNISKTTNQFHDFAPESINDLSPLIFAAFLRAYPKQLLGIYMKNAMNLSKKNNKYFLGLCGLLRIANIDAIYLDNLTSTEGTLTELIFSNLGRLLAISLAYLAKHDETTKKAAFYFLIQLAIGGCLIDGNMSGAKELQNLRQTLNISTQITDLYYQHCMILSSKISNLVGFCSDQFIATAFSILKIAQTDQIVRTRSNSLPHSLISQDPVFKQSKLTEKSKDSLEVFHPISPSNLASHNQDDLNSSKPIFRSTLQQRKLSNSNSTDNSESSNQNIKVKRKSSIIHTKSTNAQGIKTLSGVIDLSFILDQNDKQNTSRNGKKAKKHKKIHEKKITNSESKGKNTFEHMYSLIISPWADIRAGITQTTIRSSLKKFFQTSTPYAFSIKLIDIPIDLFITKKFIKAEFLYFILKIIIIENRLNFLNTCVQLLPSETFSFLVQLLQAPYFYYTTSNSISRNNLIQKIINLFLQYSSLIDNFPKIILMIFIAYGAVFSNLQLLSRILPTKKVFVDIQSADAQIKNFAIEEGVTFRTRLGFECLRWALLLNDPPIAARALYLYTDICDAMPGDMEIASAITRSIRLALTAENSGRTDLNDFICNALKAELKLISRLGSLANSQEIYDICFASIISRVSSLKKQKIAFKILKNGCKSGILRGLDFTSIPNSENHSQIINKQPLALAFQVVKTVDSNSLISFAKCAYESNLSSIFFGNEPHPNTALNLFFLLIEDISKTEITNINLDTFNHVINEGNNLNDQELKLTILMVDVICRSVNYSNFAIIENFVSVMISKFPSAFQCFSDAPLKSLSIQKSGAPEYEMIFEESQKDNKITKTTELIHCEEFPPQWIHEVPNIRIFPYDHWEKEVKRAKEKIIKCERWKSPTKFTGISDDNSRNDENHEINFTPPDSLVEKIGLDEISSFKLPPI